MSNYILGVNISHHPSLALLKDGELVYYLEDDRWNRIKEEEWQLTSNIRSIMDLLKYTRHIDHVIFASFCKDETYDAPDRYMIEVVKKQLDQYKITYDKIYYYREHHLYHACSAFYGSGFDEAAALVLDGGGAYFRDYAQLRESETMYYFSDIGKVDLVKRVYTPQFILNEDPPVKINDNEILSSTMSCGWIFNTISFTICTNSPGKTMGLSPYGSLDDLQNEEWFYYDESVDCWLTNNKTILNTYRRCYNDPDFVPHGDVLQPDFIFDVGAKLAKKAQIETKNHTIRLIQDLIDKTQSKNVVLSGGYFLNCVNNYEYIKAFPEINFFIDPTSHDGGIAIGSAKYVWHHLLNNKTKYPLETLYLGG